MLPLEEKICALREEISRIDKGLIELLVKRQGLIEALGPLKKEAGLAILAPEQEEKQFAAYVDLAKERNLQESFVRKVFKLIIEESRKMQGSS